jgi:aspartate kinase
MIVKKFGGTSVGDAERIRSLSDIISSTSQDSSGLDSSGEKTVLVVSAFGKNTDTLASIVENLQHHDILFAKNDLKKFNNSHKEIIKSLDLGEKSLRDLKKEILKLNSIIESVSKELDLSDNQKDSIYSSGEILSSGIIYESLKQSGLSAVYVNAAKVICTDSAHMKAEVNFDVTEVMLKSTFLPLFERYDIIVMGGFYAADVNGAITTIGRGGSDYTASIVANLLGAEKVEIWTDVDGIMTIDPKINDNARRILRLSYDEAAELAYFGARILHPKTIGPAIQANIPVLVKNSFNPSHRGTLISKQNEKRQMIKALSYWEGITVINIKSNRMLGAYGFLSQVFDVFRIYETSVDLIATSEVSISLTIDNTRHLTRILQELEKFSNTSIHLNHAIISAIGNGIKKTSGIASRFFGKLKEINISMVSIGASEVNLSVVIHEGDTEKALNLLHDEFFSGELDEEIFSH